eukprot:g1827.t1
MFIVELWILWSVDALQTLLKLIEPYAVLALLILTLIFPFALRAYRELRKAGEKLSEAQQVLDNLQEKFFGDMKKVAKRFEVVGETLTGMDLGCSKSYGEEGWERRGASSAAGSMTSNVENYKGVLDGRLGFGQKAAVLVIDFTKAYTTPSSPFYCNGQGFGAGPHLKTSISKARWTLKLALDVGGVPIIYTKMFYEHPTDGGVFAQKVPLLRTWRKDNPLVEIDDSIKPCETDIIIVKQYPSTFFGTNVACNLRAIHVDTCIIVGCSTSGCIRSSVLDGMQYGFRCIVPRECVGDRTQSIHEANLFDMNAKNGDVLSKKVVMDYLNSLGTDMSSRPSKRLCSEQADGAGHVPCGVEALQNLENYQGVFDGKLGFGRKVALIVIDFTKAYVTPSSPFYCNGHPNDRDAGGHDARTAWFVGPRGTGDVEPCSFAALKPRRATRRRSAGMPVTFDTDQVLPGQDVAPVPCLVFTVELNRTAGSSFGTSVGRSRPTPVAEGSLVGEWNRKVTIPENQIRQFDRLMSLNGEKPAKGKDMLERLRDATGMVSILVQRPQDLGLSVIDGQSFLLVTRITDGAISDHNASASPKDVVKVPSRIVSVNGKKGKGSELLKFMEPQSSPFIVYYCGSSGDAAVEAEEAGRYAGRKPFEEYEILESEFFDLAGMAHGVASAHARGKNAASRGAKGSKDKSRRPEAGHADVFRVDYFEGSAFLAQSPQLYKQMALMTDMPRVFEVGPIFRSEKSFTHRHMTEFTGLDIEMTFKDHYHEVLEVLDGLFNHIFKGLTERFGREIEAVKSQGDLQDLKWKHPCLRLKCAARAGWNWKGWELTCLLTRHEWSPSATAHTSGSGGAGGVAPTATTAVHVESAAAIGLVESFGAQQLYGLGPRLGGLSVLLGFRRRRGRQLRGVGGGCDVPTSSKATGEGLAGGRDQAMATAAAGAPGCSPSSPAMGAG